MFAPNEGIMEDVQGVELRRPSQLYASAKKIDGQVEQTFIGGSVIIIAEGKLLLS